MPESFTGTVSFLNSNGETIVVIDPDVAPAPIRFLDPVGNTLLEITFSADLSIGGGGEEGDISLRLGNGDETIHLSAERATIEAGGNSENGLFVLRNPTGEIVVRAQAADGSLVAGGHGVEGALALHRSPVTQIGNFAQAAIHADAGTGRIDFRDAAGNRTMRLEGDAGNIRAGGAPDADGDLVLFRRGEDININDASQAAIHADASAGRIDFRDAAGNRTMRLEGDAGNIRIGGAPGIDGDIVIFPSGEGININDASQATIHMNGDTGDIILRNADCAEEFSVTHAHTVHPGVVMVLNEQGLLQPSDKAYDKCVVGVVSGAGDYRPGIVLDKQPAQDNREPIALMGKVYCQVTAETVPIKVGDLLTTSDVPGHAMKANDPVRSFGAVIGKALRPLPAGRAIMPILVALQ